MLSSSRHCGRCKGFIIDVSIVAGPVMVVYSLHFDQLCIFVMVSTCSKEMHLRRATLSCGYKDKNLEDSWKSYWFGNVAAAGSQCVYRGGVLNSLLPPYLDALNRRIYHGVFPQEGSCVTENCPPAPQLPLPRTMWSQLSHYHLPLRDSALLWLLSEEKGPVSRWHSSTPSEKLAGGFSWKQLVFTPSC